MKCIPIFRIRIILLLLSFFVLLGSGPHSKAQRKLATSALPDAFLIAQRCILKNIAFVDGNSTDPGHKEFLLAGANQYHSLWVRDFAMSAFGALVLGRGKAVRDSLEIIFKFQRGDGLFPRLVDNQEIGSRVVLGLMGFPPAFGKPLRGWYETENHVVSIDENAVVPWAASRYIEFAKDREFAMKWFSGAERAIAYLEGNFLVDGLVGKQPPFSDWEDSVSRTGRVAFTNELFILSLRGMARWASFIGNSEKASYYRNKAARFTERFRKFFWMPEKKMIRNFEGDNHLTADANLIAVAYQLLPEKESRELMDMLRKSPIWDPIPGRATWPDYPESVKSTAVKFSGLSGYHDSLYWIWITAMAAKAERAIGNCLGYHQILDRLSARIASEGGISEVYDLALDGSLRPANRVFYRAERPFTWNCALFLEAVAQGCR